MSRAAHDRSVRVQFAAALAVGLILFATGLYLWRRPHAPADAQETDADSASSAGDAAPAPAASAIVEAGTPSPVTLSDARVLGCHDRGPKKTAADQCDHLVSIEKALTNAVEEAATCVPTSVSGGTIEYVADVSFSRHRLSVSLPRAGRSVRDRKILGACATSVRSAMHALPLDGLDHQHARYQISVTATYRGSARGG
jgi:hypothetical protein